MTGLEPDTLYAYRVGDGVRWSEWNQFRTASAKPAPFSFIYLGDEQNNLLSSCARVLRQAFRQAPDARFIVHAGDLTNSANVDDEWREWHEVGGWLNAMVPSVPTPGNHQYGRFGEDPSAPSELTRHWKPQFALPLNGPAGLEESTYWFDYQGVRVISLNSCERQQEQVPWLTRVLEDNPNRWTVITFHHPIYSGAKGRDNKELRDAWKPIFERFKVDLVLQGHDHVYARSKPEPGSKSPVPVYVVSVCGQKMYDLKPGISTVRAGEDTQLYQVITVDGARLELAAYTASGELYDRFELRKGGGGSVSLREALPKNTPERHRPAKSGAAN
jgi:3',5'-cyclic AMP phosphodiesterase CpdA